MIVQLKKLSWANLFSYGDNNSIDLNSDQITQLIGLNGHGKSSIPLILEETLFNKNSKGIKKSDILNRSLNTSKYSASCVFSVDNDDYEIVISRSGNTQKVKLLKNNIDISSHTATDSFKQVEELFGLDAKTFSQLVYQNSTSSLQFLTATDSNRKKFLIDLLSLDRYVVIFEKIKDIHKQASDSISRIESKQQTIKAWINKVSQEDLVSLNILDLPKLDETKVTKLSELKSTILELESLNKKILANNEYKRILSEINPISLVSDKVLIPTDEIKKQKNFIEYAINTKKSVLTKYSKVNYSECPTCAQPVDLSIITKIIDEATLDISSNKLLLEQLETKLKEIETNNKLVLQHQQLVTDFEKYSNLIDSTLPKVIKDKNELLREVNELTAYVSDINKAIEKINKSNQVAIDHNAKITAIKGQLESYSKELNDVSLELLALQKNFGLLEVLKKTFSTSGLIAYKIEASVKELESLTNNYLTELSDGRFQLLFTINNDKLNVVIIDSGKQIEITALSAGELSRVTTATLLAIRKLMSTLSKNKLNVLFLDETVDVLDTYGKEKLVEVLLKEDDLNCFIISHGYSHPLISKINIIKENNISRLENG